MFLLRSLTPPRQLHLSTLFFSTPSSLDGSTPLNTSICRELLKLYILVCRDPILIFSISPTCSPPKSLSLTPNLFPKCFPSIFKVFSSLGKLRFSHFHAFHSLKPKLLGFLQNLGFFKIKEVFMQFLGWVLKIHS